jgi:electron transport complex protein RnfB
MDTGVYGKLRSYYHKHPLGFPDTESRLAVEILKRLFSEDEAEMALNLTPRPETAKALAGRVGKDPEELASLLERMADKGLIFTFGEKGNRHFMLAPYIPGFWDFQVKRMDREVAEVFEAYYVPQAREMFSSVTPPVRVVTVEKHLPSTLRVYPFEVASQIVRESKKISLTDCICRKQQKLLGKGCNKPHEEVCIQLSPGAEYYIERGLGREASVEDALEVIEKGEQAGLVRTAWLNVQKGPIAFCQCCSCCCHGLRAVYELKIPNAVAKSNFVPMIDVERCTGCNACVDTCPMDALSLDESQEAVRNPDRCIGCGLCVSACPEGSIRLERVAEEHVRIPPETHSALLTVIAREKGKTHFYK